MDTKVFVMFTGRIGGKIVSNENAINNLLEKGWTIDYCLSDASFQGVDPISLSVLVLVKKSSTEESQ